MKSDRRGGASLFVAMLRWAGTLAVLLAVAAPGLAADRMVLCEEFTDIWCYGCSYAGPALGRLLDVYPESFAFVQFHALDDWANDWSIARWGYYDGEYTPMTIFDGTDRSVGAVSDVDQEYRILRTTHFLPERAIPTDVTLHITGEYLEGQTYRFTAEVGIEASGTAKTLRVYIVQVLDHFPDVRPYHRNGFKQGASPVDVSLVPGQSQFVSTDFTLDAESWAAQEQVKIIAWAQASADHYPAHVYQAAQRLWPLETVPGDDDGDGTPDAEDNCPTRYNPGQADGDGDGFGDVCDRCVDLPNPDQTDVDEDTFGDACDNCPIVHSIYQDDNDGDGLGSPCDSCADVPAPAGTNSSGRSLGCIDLDCDVDALDFALFSSAVAGPDITTPPAGCDPQVFAQAVLDADGDVDLADIAVFQTNFTGPLESPPIYVGSTYCVSCHTANHTDWLGTIHATAFNTLVQGGNGNNELCFPCHSVGYGSPSGFVNLDTTPQLANVQCESCHGPGSNHVADPNGVPLSVLYESALCGSCHQSCHGLCGENHHPQYEEWQLTPHRYALMNIQFLPETVPECLQCHSTDYRLAPEGQKPGVWEVIYGIECVACHDPHGGVNLSQLRLPPAQLCADCHTMGADAPGVVPIQPQAEMLHSVGGYMLDGTPLTAPYTEHWWGVPKECVQCHVHMEPSGGPEQPAIAGHLFLHSVKACLPCHTEEVATALRDTLREEFDIRLGTIAPYFDPNEPDYIDPATLPPPEQEQYWIAKFNYDMVVADRSRGSHNPGYARALLVQTETFLGIPPWELRKLQWIPQPGPETATESYPAGRGEVSP